MGINSVKQTVLIIAVFAMAAMGAFAQDYSYHAYKNNKDQYAQPLSDLLETARADLGVTIEIDKNVEPFLSETVSMAPWKFWDNPELRLAYILAPLDLSFEKTGDTSYRVFEPWYQNRPESEGAAHLKRLLRRYPDRASFEQRQACVKAAMLDALRLNPMPIKTPLNPIYGEEKTFDGYSVVPVAIEVIPRYWLCGSLYRPTEENGPFAPIASPHGHGTDGRLSDDNQYRCATLARMGAFVFSYSMFAWIAEESPLVREDHRHPISGTMQTLGTIRVIDFLTSLDNADTSRIGITGCSGGGTQTFFAAALDERIKVSVPVVMVSSHFFGGCPCESGTPLHTKAQGTCNAEIAALAAPRPQLLIAVTQDWTNNTPEVEYPYLRSIYEYFDAADNVEFAIYDEPHNYGVTKRTAMYPFMAKHLGLDISKADESKVTIQPREDMLVFGKNREKYPSGAIQNIEELIEAFDNAPRP